MMSMYLFTTRSRLPGFIAKTMMAAVLGAFVCATGSAEPRTLTDKSGRTIKAEVLSVEGDVVKVRREDGQVFTLPLSNLSYDDQIALRKWAKANPPAATPPAAEPENKPFVPTAGSITLGVTRGKFNSDVAYQSTSFKDAYEEWGYNVQLTNTTLHSIDDLRLEYKIYGRAFSGSRQTVESGTQTIEPLGSRKSVSFRTKAFRFNKARSTDGSYNYTGGVTGVWMRLYHGSNLLHEYVSPESIKTKEQWSASTE
jgi:hypothetical protein